MNPTFKLRDVFFGPFRACVTAIQLVQKLDPQWSERDVCKRACQVIEIAIVKILATPDPRFDTLPLPRPFQSLSSLSSPLIQV